MNRRIKKKKAKQLAQKKQIELENKLRKLSQEEIEALSRMIKQIVSDISKAFSKMFDSLFNYLENSEVKFEEIEQQGTSTTGPRTIQVPRYPANHRVTQAGANYQKPRQPRWDFNRNQQTNRNHRGQARG